MAVIEKNYRAEELPPEISKEPALAALDFLKDFQIPELETSSNPDEVFYDYQLGRVFSSIIETHGSRSIRSPHYAQLSGSDGKERFLATYFPGYSYGDNGEKVKPGSVHAVISPVASFHEQGYTIPVTISLGSGVPLARKNLKIGNHGRVELGGPMGPADSMAEVRHLAALMSSAFRNPETELGDFSGR
jgi:hypothetical protein